MTLIKKSEELSREEVKGLPLCDDEGSLMGQCYIGNNSLLAAVELFN
jgi:hypothetical protein